jgi:hypothetical protein
MISVKAQELAALMPLGFSLTRNLFKGGKG